MNSTATAPAAITFGLDDRLTDWEAVGFPSLQVFAHVQHTAVMLQCCGSRTGGAVVETSNEGEPVVVQASYALERLEDENGRLTRTWTATDRLAAKAFSLTTECGNCQGCTNGDGCYRD